MSRDRFHFQLGLFTLAGLVIAFIGVVFLGDGSWHRQTFTIETYFDQSVSGLSVGAPVRHRGVDVGRVTKINFVTSKYQIPTGSGGGRRTYAMANLILVEASVDREAVRPLDAPDGDPKSAVDAMIKDGLRIRLVSSLLGGGGYLDADFIDPSIRQVPPAIPWVPLDIYIPSQPNSTNQLIDNLDRVAAEIESAHPGELMKHVDALVVDANRLTKGIDAEQLEGRAIAVLDNLKSLAESLQKTIKDPRIDDILTNTSALTGNAKTITDPQNSELVHLLADARSTAGKLNSLLADPALKAAISNTGPLTADARRLMSRLSELVAGEREELFDLIHSLRATAKNVEDITSDAKDNPSRILFGAPPPKIGIHISPEKK